MRKLLLSLATLLLAAPALAFQPDVNEELQLDAAKAILAIKKADPGIEAFFNNAAGYAVFPSVGKGGIVVGGAYGKGLVIVGGQVDGYTTMTQATVGLQLGGQVYALFIFFKDAAAIANFKRGNYEFGAQASAVAATAGASADTSYDKGVAVFTHATGGLMVEGSVGGQKFTYEPKK
ncbi:MAG TPA: YSC84-related protein [Xanthomonadales bacterium]|nr:YSC84-related protein [Xanthomonadales bacterium]